MASALFALINKPTLRARGKDQLGYLRQLFLDKIIMFQSVLW